MGLDTFSLKIYPVSTLKPILIHHFFTGVCKHESYVFEYPPPPRGNIFKLDLRVAQQDPYLATLGKIIKIDQAVEAVQRSDEMGLESSPPFKRYPISTPNPISYVLTSTCPL